MKNKFTIIPFTFLFNYTETNAQCASAVTFTSASTTLISGSGTGTLASPYTNGSVVKFCVTIRFVWQERSSNWFHGVGINAGSNFCSLVSDGVPSISIANGSTTSGCTISGSASPWVFADPSSSAPIGWYFDTDNDGNVNNNYGINGDCSSPPSTGAAGPYTLTFSFCFRATVCNVPVGGTIQSPSFSIFGDGQSGSWNSTACGTPANNTPSAWNGISGGLVLPVNWISQTANVITPDLSKISWKVSEMDVYSYEIEKSLNGRDFTTIAAIPSTGNGEHTYSFIDNQFANKTSYYRIKQMDRSGAYSYSAIMSVRAVKNDFKLVVYPNPATSATTIYISDSKYLNTNVLLTDMAGKIMQKIKIEGNSNLLNLANIPSGTYLLRFVDGTVSKIIKY